MDINYDSDLIFSAKHDNVPRKNLEITLTTIYRQLNATIVLQRFSGSSRVKFFGTSRIDGNTRGSTETASSRVGLPNQACYTNPGRSTKIDRDNDAVISNLKFPKILREPLVLILSVK